MHNSQHPVRKLIHLSSHTVVLRWRPEDDEGKATWVDYAICRQINLDGPAEFWLDEHHGRETTSDPASAEAEVTGYVKWDGCTQVDVDSHCCSHADLVALMEAIGKACVEAYACTSQDGEY